MQYVSVACSCKLNLQNSDLKTKEVAYNYSTQDPYDLYEKWFLHVCRSCFSRYLCCVCWEYIFGQQGQAYGIWAMALRGLCLNSMYDRSRPGAIWVQKQKITSPELESQLEPKIFLVSAYQNKWKMRGWKWGFYMRSMVVCQKKNNLCPTSNAVTHILRSYGHIVQSHSFLIFKRDHAFLHSQGILKTSLFCAAFSSLQSQDSLPAETPCSAAFTCHGVENELKFFSEWGKGIFQTGI